MKYKYKQLNQMNGKAAVNCQVVEAKLIYMDLIINKIKNYEKNLKIIFQPIPR